jgi:hypothetical protein
MDATRCGCGGGVLPCTHTHTRAERAPTAPLQVEFDEPLDMKEAAMREAEEAKQRAAAAEPAEGRVAIGEDSRCVSAIVIAFA